LILEVRTANGKAGVLKGGYRYISKNLGFLFFVLIAVIVMLGIINPLFLTLNNGITVLRQACFLALISCGQMLVILTAGVDVSLGAIIGLCSVLAAIGSKLLGAAAGWATAVLVGMGVGLFNGFVVGRFRIDSFAVTLGTMSICSGLALIISKGLTIYELPDAYQRLAYSEVWLIPLPVIIAVIVIVIMYFVLYRIQFGR
jgi:ribose transport system permease protein